MEFEADRRANGNHEPSLADMTRAAIERLARDDKGYFLFVEGGRIDHAHHNGNAARALHDTIAFSQAVETALGMVDLDDTLVIVTADHGHVMSMSGYPQRGNPILGKVVQTGLLSPKGPAIARDSDGLPFTTLSYANGPGHRDTSEGRPDLTEVDTADLDYLQEALVPIGAETHSGTDVIVYADGPGADLFHGVREQNFVYHVMRYASGL
jgi:alkaline phosphatase